MTNRSKFIALVSVALAACLPFKSIAATTNIIVGVSSTLRFSPVVTTINVGDTIIWTWASSFHSTTSGTVSGTTATPNGVWDSGFITSIPHSFTNTINTAGNYSYYCSAHFTSGMTGAVIVASVATAPTVTITSPTNGSVFNAPLNLTIQAVATNAGPTVTNVQFLLGTSVISNVTTTPYTAKTNNLPAGAYSLSAIAMDSGGLTATNSVSISVVTPVPVSLTNSVSSSGTNFQFSYAANVGLSYIVQFSTNLTLTNWVSLVTNVAASNPVVFVDTHATNSPAFYRVGRLPNP